MEQKQTEQATTNSYDTLIKCRIPDFNNVSLVVGNSDNTNDLTLQILVSNDPQGSTVSYAQLELDSSGNKEVTIHEEASVAYDLPLFIWYDVQVKSTIEDAAAEANCWLHAR